MATSLVGFLNGYGTIQFSYGLSAFVWLCALQCSATIEVGTTYSVGKNKNDEMDNKYTKQFSNSMQALVEIINFAILVT